MRLDDFDPNINVEDQRGQNFGGGGGFGGFGGGMGGMLLPFVFSRFGCGGVVVLLLILAVLGGNPLGLLGGGGGQVGPSPAQRSGETVQQMCTVDQGSREACNAFSSADRTWAQILQQQGVGFTPPKLVFYSGSGRSGCGAAQSAMGPFYCPTDQGIYLDTSFFDELANKFGAKGDFARDYVIAHEFGHHIQNLLGTSAKVGAGAEGATGASVRLELQADCYAGVWAAANRDRLDPGDVEEGMTAAQSIGDDRLQQESTGRVMPDKFTHGTSAQRMKWLRRGMDTGDMRQCDTFSGAI